MHSSLLVPRETVLCSINGALLFHCLKNSLTAGSDCVYPSLGMMSKKGILNAILSVQLQHGNYHLHLVLYLFCVYMLMGICVLCYVIIGLQRKLKLLDQRERHCG